MPSNSILVQKQQLVADLAEQIKNSAAGVVVNYQGITVENDTAMRKALREAGVKYVVMKNTMTGRACDMVGYGDLKQYLTGMTAIAISESDPVAAAKVLKKYANNWDMNMYMIGNNQSRKNGFSDWSPANFFAESLDEYTDNIKNNNFFFTFAKFF